MDIAAKTIDERDLRIADLQADNILLQQRFDEIKRQLDWFKRELFGPKSERREVHPDQLALFESLLEGLSPAPEVTSEVPAHTRRKKRSDSDVNDTGLRFIDEVPLEVVELRSRSTLRYLITSLFCRNYFVIPLTMKSISLD